MPTRTQQGDILALRLRLARRHQAHPALPREPRRVLPLRGRGVRSGRALPDAGVHAHRPRHRHERLGRARASSGTTRYRPDRGRVLTREELEAMPKFFRYSPEDELDVAARTLPGRAREGRVLHARLGPQQARRLHRDPRRVPGGDGPPARASTTRRATHVPERRSSSERRRRDVRRRLARRLRSRGARGARGARASAGIVGRLLRVRGFPFGDEVEAFSPRTSASSSSSRTATRSCGRC